MNTDMENVQNDIETRVAELDSQLEVIAVEEAGPGALRLYIDHPDGVDLSLCERVTNQLRDLTAEYSLEVSSPGAERPLTKPEHYRRFAGRRVRVRTRDEVEGRRSFTGTIAGADDAGVEVAMDDGRITIPHERIRRSNLVPDTTHQGGLA